MLDKPTAKDAQGVVERRAAFEDAIHSLKMEDVDLDLNDVPELQAVIVGKMSFDEAEQAIFEQFANGRRVIPTFGPAGSYAMAQGATIPKRF